LETAKAQLSNDKARLAQAIIDHQNAAKVLDSRERVFKQQSDDLAARKLRLERVIATAATFE
jgi:hypothetical protein